MSTHFNPRTREGCDAKFHVEFRRLEHFNPRTREGCDSLLSSGWARRAGHFNPRTREGCDSLQIGSVTICSLINHIAN